VGVMIRSFPPHPNPLPPGERGSHSSPQQSWWVFWHFFIKRYLKMQMDAKEKREGAAIQTMNFRQ
jgi:hypothetical protein